MQATPWNISARISFRTALVPALSLAVTAIAATEAAAVSARVRVACASDYFSYCREHAVGSAALRQCMRDVGPRLSKRCVNALVAEGEVSEAEVARRAAELR